MQPQMPEVVKPTTFPLSGHRKGSLPVQSTSSLPTATSKLTNLRVGPPLSFTFMSASRPTNSPLSNFTNRSRPASNASWSFVMSLPKSGTPFSMRKEFMATPPQSPSWGSTSWSLRYSIAASFLCVCNSKPCSPMKDMRTAVTSAPASDRLRHWKGLNLSLARSTGRSSSFASVSSAFGPLRNSTARCDVVSSTLTSSPAFKCVRIQRRSWSW
mmetsp:Transcript_106391/g.297905  ORF Transcript_106391/g.297905 Transcript_106391/m.297905 type:complete len:213 (-) Transcript_106391:1901-2539(-)